MRLRMYIALYVDYKGMAFGLFRESTSLELINYKMINHVSIEDAKSFIETWENEHRNKIRTILTNQKRFDDELDNTTLNELPDIENEIINLIINVNDKKIIVDNKIRNEINNELQNFDINVVNHIIYMMIIGMKDPSLSYEWMREI